MSTYNIEMNTYNGTGYDVLLPQTVINNITDWNNSIYNKTEINNLIDSINSEVSNIQNKKFEQYCDTSITLSSSTFFLNTNIALNFSINNVNFLIIVVSGTNVGDVRLKFFGCEEAFLGGKKDSIIMAWFINNRSQLFLLGPVSTEANPYTFFSDTRTVVSSYFSTIPLSYFNNVREQSRRFRVYGY